MPVQPGNTGYLSLEEKRTACTITIALAISLSCTLDRFYLHKVYKNLGKITKTIELVKENLERIKTSPGSQKDLLAKS